MHTEKRSWEWSEFKRTEGKVRKSSLSQNRIEKLKIRFLYQDSQIRNTDYEVEQSDSQPCTLEPRDRQ